MSTLNTMVESVKNAVSQQLQVVRVKVLGANNERLDFLLDTFNKQNPAQKNGILAAGVLGIFLFVVMAFYLYFNRVGALQAELNDTFAALRELKALKVEDEVISERFKDLVDTIKSRTRSLSAKPFFEKISDKLSVSMQNIDDQAKEIDPSNPLSKDLKELQIKVRISKISIPKLLKFLVEIEKSGQFLRVQNLKISGQYGNKLYFDVDILVRGYKVASGAASGL